MIGYLRGKILEQTEGRLLVLGGSGESGIGYQVNVPGRAGYGLFAKGAAVELFIHTHVREDAFDLYGFATTGEKELFLTLLSVNGIGPKGALGILSGCEPTQLIDAIIDGDKAMLTRIPGIGKKTAERVVLELAEPMQKRRAAGVFGNVAPAGASAAGVALPASTTSGGARAGGLNALIREAREALVGLGYRDQDVTTLLNRVVSEFDTPPKRSEDLIKSALRQLA